MDGLVAQMYFFNTVEISIDIEKEIRSRSRVPVSKELENQRSLKMAVNITLMDTSENILEGEIVEERNISRLIVSNLEKKPNWYGPEPNPYMKFLDMCVLDEEGYNLMEKNQKILQSGVTVPFKALHRNYRIHKTKLRSSVEDIKFHAVIDGSYYGPYSEIEIKPISVIPNKHMYLPIMTFMPISEIS